MNPITKQFLLSVSRWLMAFGLVVFVVCLASPAEAAEGAPTVTMQSALVEIIQQVQTGVQSGVSFLQQEIPDVVRQLLIWKATQAGIWIAIYLFLFIVGVIALKAAIQSIYTQFDLEGIQDTAEAIDDSLSHRDDLKPEARKNFAIAKANTQANVSRVVIRCILGVVLTITGIIAFCSLWFHILTVLQIYMAPKVWLIEYAASMVK